jgi:serine/threonine protein kinase
MTQPRVLGGRYELDRVVGRGGMAEVFRARDIRLDRVVGVKKLLNDLARDETSQARFRREARSAASLNHPSIVAVYDTGEDMVGGTPVPYIVMEFVDGRTLRDLLREDRQVLAERAAEITDGLLRALDYSHRNGIVHRDVKPGNVILTESGDVKVTDFGIARAMSDTRPTMTQASQVMGTAQYLSPEQAQGERVDARSDLYSAGCVFYELLAGRPPFTGYSPVAIAYQHVKEDPVPPSRVHPEVPAWADAIVLQAMQKDPAQRYQSADEMRNDIQRALAGAPVAAPKRKAWPWATLAVLIVLLAVVIFAVKFLTGSNNGVGVPSVTGMSLLKAEHAITGAGLRVGKLSYTSSAAVAKNDVISTSPSDRTQVPKGSAVNVAVSDGFVPAGRRARSRHIRSASPAPTGRSSPRTRSPGTTSPGTSSPGTSSPGTSSPGTGSPSPSPTRPSPSASTSCAVDIAGICV